MHDCGLKSKEPEQVPCRVYYHACIISSLEKASLSLVGVTLHNI